MRPTRKRRNAIRPDVSPCDECGHHHLDGFCRHRIGARRCGCPSVYLCGCGHVHRDVCTECDCTDWGRDEWILWPGGSPTQVIWLLALIAFMAVLVLIALA